MKSNRVEYGLTNVYFAVRLQGMNYEVPIRMLGAASIQLTPVDDTIEEELYDGELFNVILNQGYTATLNLAVIPEDFSLKCLGEEKNSEGLVIERAKYQQASFALLFEFDGDEHKTRHVLLNCKASRSELVGETKSAELSINTNAIPMRVLPLGEKRFVKAKARQGTSKYDQWFEKVITLV